MPEMATDDYDLVRYNNLALPQTHPSRLRALGKLSGLEPAAVETCSLLELGASEGANLIPMAHRFPCARFVGVDLAREPIERGRAFVREFGLRNLRLEIMNALDIKAGFGQFDYIVAHGLYGWTPAIVGDKILQIMGALLSPQGIGFVSYNAQPAGHIRKMVREMMLFHTRDATDPRDKVLKAREMLAALARPRDAGQLDAYDAVLIAQAADLAQRPDSALFHDDLAPVYEPVSLTGFVAHLGRHGMQYVNDAGAFDPQGDVGPSRLDLKGVESARTMAGGDRIAELQYQDYLRMRRFRQSMVCRAEIPVTLQWGSATAVGLHASTRVVEMSEGVFATTGEFRISTTHPAPVAYLRRLIGLWPASEPVSTGDAEVATALFSAGAIALDGTASAAVRVGERPCADELIRFQAHRGDAIVTTLRHKPLQLDDGTRKLVALLDGTRDCERLALAAQCTVAAMRAELDDLARNGLLIA